MNNNAEKQYELNKELAQMLKGGVIMDVTTPEQAGKNRRGSRSMCGYGIRKNSGRYSCSRWSFKNE